MSGISVRDDEGVASAFHHHRPSNQTPVHFSTAHRIGVQIKRPVKRPPGGQLQHGVQVRNSCGIGRNYRNRGPKEESSRQWHKTLDQQTRMAKSLPPQWQRNSDVWLLCCCSCAAAPVLPVLCCCSCAAALVLLLLCCGSCAAALVLRLLCCCSCAAALVLLLTCCFAAASRALSNV